MIYELDFYRLFTTKPELIEEGLEIHDYKHQIKTENKKFEVDLLGEDKDGNLIPIEIKVIKVGRGFKQVSDYVEAMKAPYGILVVVNPESHLTSEGKVKYVPVFIENIELVSNYNIRLFKKEDVETLQTIEQNSGIKLRNRIKIAREKTGNKSMIKIDNEEARFTEKAKYYIRNDKTCSGNSTNNIIEEEERRMRIMNCIWCHKELFEVPEDDHIFVFCSSKCVEAYRNSRDLDDYVA